MAHNTELRGVLRCADEVHSQPPRRFPATPRHPRQDSRQRLPPLPQSGRAGPSWLPRRQRFYGQRAGYQGPAFLLFQQAFQTGVRPDVFGALGHGHSLLHAEIRPTPRTHAGGRSGRLDPWRMVPCGTDHGSERCLPLGGKMAARRGSATDPVGGGGSAAVQDRRAARSVHAAPFDRRLPRLPLCHCGLPGRASGPCYRMTRPPVGIRDCRSDTVACFRPAGAFLQQHAMGSDSAPPTVAGSAAT